MVIALSAVSMPLSIPFSEFVPSYIISFVSLSIPSLYLPVVPHKAVAEVSKIGNL